MGEGTCAKMLTCVMNLMHVFTCTDARLVQLLNALFCVCFSCFSLSWVGYKSLSEKRILQAQG